MQPVLSEASPVDAHHGLRMLGGHDGLSENDRGWGMGKQGCDVNPSSIQWPKFGVSCCARGAWSATLPPTLPSCHIVLSAGSTIGLWQPHWQKPQGPAGIFE